MRHNGRPQVDGRAALLAAPEEHWSHMRRHRSLTFKIVLECLVLLVCLFAAIVAGGAYYQQAIVQEMEEKSAEILKGIEVQVTQAEGAALDDLLLHLREQQEVDAIVFFDPDERVTASASSPRLAGAEPGRPNEGLQIGRIEGPGGPLTAYAQTLPLIAGGDVLGHVKVAMAVEPQGAIVRAFRSKMLWALIAAFCVTMLVMCRTVVVALRPLRDLSAHLDGVGSGRLEPVSVSANSSEVAVLQETFNGMVAALEEKERMAERLRQSQRLSAMGNLAAGVAHDIGNPLNSIQLTASHLNDILNNGSGDNVPEARRYLAMIGEEVARLDGLVRSFLTLAREQEPSKSVVSPDAIMSDALRLVRAEARRRRIDLRETLEAGEVGVLLDQGQMKGALINVLVNAFDAAGAGGRVEVRTRRANGAIHIEIADSGPGIPPEMRDRIFEPYFTTKPGGTGLGLALSRTVIEQHGGTIEVESEMGRGTTMLVTLHPEDAHV